MHIRIYLSIFIFTLGTLSAALVFFHALSLNTSARGGKKEKNALPAQLPQICVAFCIVGTDFVKCRQRSHFRGFADTDLLCI